MFNKMCIITFIFFASNVNAGQTPVKINPLVKRFVAEYGKNTYRSGILNPSTDNWVQANEPTDFPTEQRDIEHPINSYEKWQKKSDNEYKVLWHTPKKKFVKYLAKILDKQDTSIFYDSLTHVFTIKYDYNDDRFLRKFLTEKYDTTLETNVIRNLKQKSRMLLSRFQGKIEDDKVDLCHINGRLSSVKIIFRRIFRHGILPASLSYVAISYDVEGAIKEITIKWPMFDKIAVDDEAIGFQESIDSAVVISSENDKAEMDDIIIDCKESTIQGIACSWKMLQTTDGIEIISPCFSFQNSTILVNGDTTIYFSNVPRLKKYFAK